MRATKLLCVSVTLWAVVVGADSASAGGPSVTPPVRLTPSLPLSIKPGQIKPVGVGGSLPTGFNSGARINQPVGVGGSLPTGFNSQVINRAGGSKTEGALGPTGSFRQQKFDPGVTGLGSGYSPNAGNAGGTSGGGGAGGGPGTRFQGTDAAEGGSGGARPARNYATDSFYNSKTACGRYPYPACK